MKAYKHCYYLSQFHVRHKIFQFPMLHQKELIYMVNLLYYFIQFFTYFNTDFFFLNIIKAYVIFSIHTAYSIWIIFIFSSFRTFLLHFLSSNLFFSDWKLVDLVLCEVTTYDKILQKKGVFDFRRTHLYRI